MNDNLPVPQSFLDRPCSRCGSREVRYRADGRPLCPCYWNPPKNQSGTLSGVRVQATMEELRRQVKR